MTCEPDDLDRLVAAFRTSGDEDAFRRLVEETEWAVRSLVATFAPSLDLVDEVVQLTYVVAFRRLADYEPRGTFLAWLKGIARNTLRSELRNLRKTRLAPADLLDRWLLDDGLTRLERDEAAGDERTARLAWLHACLAEVGDHGRRILHRRYQDGLPLADLAREFAKSQAAMAKIVQRLVIGLRDCIGRRSRHEAVP